MYLAFVLTHPRERDAAVAAAGALGGLLVVVRHKLAPGSLHHLGLVGKGVVGMAPSVGYAPVPANHLSSAVGQQIFSGIHVLCTGPMA